MKVIVDIGVNHNGSLNTAIELVERSVDSGASMIKFQVYEEDRFPKLSFLNHDQYETLFWHCENLEIPWFATCFDEASADFCYDNGQKIWKIPSGLANDRGYVKLISKYVDRSDGRVFLSSGISTIEETIRNYWLIRLLDIPSNLIEVFHCVSQYPTLTENMNLSVIQRLQEEYSGHVSLSDHSIGPDSIMSTIMACVLGCTYLEKHITLSRNMPGPDHKASITPKELDHLVRVIDKSINMLGSTEERYDSLPKWHEETRKEIYKSMGVG